MGETIVKVMTELPQYRAHKIVGAAIITAMMINKETPDGHVTLHFDELQHPGQHHVTFEWIGRHKPRTGGYFVRYPDGYESYSPKKSFEEGYAPLGNDVHLPDGRNMSLLALRLAWDRINIAMQRKPVAQEYSSIRSGMIAACDIINDMLKESGTSQCEPAPPVAPGYPSADFTRPSGEQAVDIGAPIEHADKLAGGLESVAQELDRRKRMGATLGHSSRDDGCREEHRHMGTRLEERPLDVTVIINSTGT